MLLGTKFAFDLFSGTLIDYLKKKQKKKCDKYTRSELFSFENAQATCNQYINVL